jgi:uncharacterized OB-fold protein
MTKNSKQEPLVIGEDWHLHYDYSCGRVVSHFLRGLEQGQIEATVCPKCGMAWLPPRGYCERCFVEIDKWVPVGPEGTLEAFTIVTQEFENLPKPPYVIALCRLDGADTALTNFLQMPLDDIDQAAKQLRPGTRVRVCFHPSRAARITDFHYELAV